MILTLPIHHYYSTLKKEYNKLIQTPGSNKNLKPQELRLKILLIFSIISFILIDLVQLINWFINTKKNYSPIIYTSSILIFLFFLLWLSKKSKIKIASWLLIMAYAFPTFHLFIIWGTSLPSALLLAVLTISLLGLLIGANLALIGSGIIGLFIIALSYLKHTNLIEFNNYWQTGENEISETFICAFLLLSIATIVWMSARNLKRALARAQRSERNLQQEYDLLETKLADKTKELYQNRKEKILELYRLARFGRLSSGIFHDLINPLTAIALNLEQIYQQDNQRIVGTQVYLKQALLATHRMEGMISGIRKQIKQKSDPTLFIVNEEIREIIQILTHKSRQAKVKIDFINPLQIELYGDTVKFGQIIINLLANAIEACEEQRERENNNNLEKIISIELINNNPELMILINDSGSGISTQNINRIFKPFFSTKKKNDRGIGLGLASVKDITEHNFGGSIKVESQKNQGSQFTLSLPFNLPKILTNSK